VTGIAAPGSAALALALAAAGLVLAPAPARRVAAVHRGRRIPSGTRRMSFAGAGLTAAGLLLGLPWWLSLLAGAAGAVAVRRVPVRSPPPDQAELRRVALLLDLLATCLESGMPVGAAISAVLDTERPTDVAFSAIPEMDEFAPALDIAVHQERPAVAPRWDGREPGRSRPAVQDVLAEVAALLALGADPPSAWRAASRHPLVEPLAGAAVRTAVGGVRMAGAVRQLAADHRSRCRALSERSAARAGVAMTAPLALCFLPAFVCLGLAPVVIGLLSTLHLW
jgi:pilus assembly protein TadC